MSIAVGGMRSATQRFETAARDIVRSGAEAQNVLNQVTDPSLSGGAPITVSGLGVPDLADSLVSMKFAEISYKASLKVFEVASRLEDELLDVIA
ncbi:MAG: hypothetical protein ACR2PM_15305 [Hyphomicrobiales bacterium]